MVARCHAQDSLGGNAKTVIIANVSPVAGCARETASTLGFAQRAKQIVNKAVVNEDTHGEAALLTRENQRLRQELQLLSETYRALQQVGCLLLICHSRCVTQGQRLFRHMLAHGSLLQPIASCTAHGYEVQCLMTREGQ